MNTVLIAGATGYLGSYVAKEFKKQNYLTKVIVRDPQKFKETGIKTDGVIIAEVTDKATLKGCCEDIDIVFSSIGITKQKDGLTYMDVDYKANLNLLEEARASCVKKFIYVSVLNGQNLRHLKICEAKEKFVEALKNSGVDYSIIRPTGYFSDMKEFYEMAEKGRVFLLGNGERTMNPIHGEDLAKACVDTVGSIDKEIPVGGPDVLTYNQIGEAAFLASGKKERITHIPDWVRRLVLLILRTFTTSKVYGPIEFFMTVLSMDMIAPKYGNQHLKIYFKELKNWKTGN